MSERESGLDVCPECKVRGGDSSEKKLYQCQYCERWFCERHLEPKSAVFRDLNKLIKDKEWRTIVEEDWKREDGHPDYAYTKERFDELKIEKEILRSKIEAFLNKSRAYRKTVPREQYATIGEHHICPRCGSNHTMTTAYREESEAFECLSCNHKWKEEKGVDSEVHIVPIAEEPKKEEKLSFVKEESPYRLIPVESKPRSHKARNAIIIGSFLVVLLIGFALFTGLIKSNIFLRSPITSFASSKTTDIFTGEKIVFNASSSYDPDNAEGKGIVTYKWNFGDGKTIVTSSNSVTYSYALVKNYTVTLAVIDDDGQNATCSTVIEVNWKVPSVNQLENWLTVDKTNEMTYHYPDFVCFNFSKMLASHARQENWKMALVLIYGYDTATQQSWNHAINGINTTEGLVYIEPQNDEVWWLTNHAQMLSGNAYNFWSSPYQTVSVHIDDILVLHLEDLDKCNFIPSSLSY